MNDKPLVNPQDELTLSVLAYAINQLDQRLAALEGCADAAPQHDFQPGWESEDTVYKAGILASDHRGYGVWLQWDKQATYAVLTIENEPAEVCFEMTPRRMGELIGALLAVLKRMEADGNADVG